MKLTDYLLACGVQLNVRSYKVHFATYSDSSPLDAFLANDFQEWQEWQRERTWSREMILSLIKVGYDRWLFAGVYKVEGFVQKEPTLFKYTTLLLPGQENLLGRIILDYHRTGRQPYRIGAENGGDLLISEIRPRKLEVEHYPGHRAVCVDYAKLKTIIDQEIGTWVGALSSSRGIYLITDTKNGKLYVGKASSAGGFWQRWTDYIWNGHGGNTELRQLLGTNPPEYLSNFQFSVLEVVDTQASNAEIDSRESHWKDVLQSRRHGYNAN